MTTPFPLPADVTRATDGGSWRLVDDDVPSFGWLVEDSSGSALLVRRDRPGGRGRPGSVAAESARIEWARQALDGHDFGVPEVVALSPDETIDGDILVTAVAPGESDLRLLPNSDDPLRIIAETLRAMHDLDASRCPFVVEPSGLIDHVAARVAAGEIDVAALHDVYRRSTPERLVEHLRTMAPEALDLDRQVVVHGQLTVHTLRVDPVRAALTGLVGWGWIGRGDRHFDLAVAARSVMRAFGGDAVGGLFARYGFDAIEPLRLEFYGLADELR